MRNILIILLLFLFWSCTSCNSEAHKTDSDSTIDKDMIDEEDIDIPDDLSDEVLTESEDTEPDEDGDVGTDSDEIPDSDYPEPTCIEIYEGNPESKLCFGPVKTNVKCNGSPEDNEFVTVLEDDNPIGSADNPMEINDNFVFFPIYIKDMEGVANIYGCNRADGYLYRIVSSKYTSPQLSVDKNFMIFNIWDGSRENSDRAKVFLGDFDTTKIKEVTAWGGYGKLQMNYPFLTYFTDTEIPNILNLETNNTKKLSRLSGPFPRNDGENLVLTGYYKQSGESDEETPFGIATWIVDMKTYEIKPLNVTATIGEGVVNIDGDYALIGSGRDLVYYGNFLNSWSGMDIYSFNMKTKREEKWTPEIKGIFEGNITKPSFEYPYFHYIANETNKIDTGASFVLNIETGETTKLWPSIGDEWMYIKDRHVILGGYYRNGIAKLPDLPRLPENADAGCEDNNVCTDNRYFVTDGKCHFIPNHERCDDKDDLTLLDVCIDGSCQGYAGTGTDEGMVEVEAGTFLYDGLEFEITEPFMMDVFEVTNSDYEKCVEAKACVPPLRSRSLTVLDYYGNPLYDNYPVLYVNQYEAQVYCNWLGKRLPTEFEWMKAAWDGEEKTYLWGEEVPTYTNYYARTTTGFSGAVGYDVVEVGTFPVDKTVSGIMDMSGNVTEWTTSEWTYDLCVTPPCDGYFGSDLVVTKGGGTDMGPELKTRHPYTPWTHSFFTGFRCVKSVKN